MISVLIVVSWTGHHPSHCVQLIRACASFSGRIYVLCPQEANPIEQLGGPADVVEKITVMFHTNRAPKKSFKEFSDLAADLRELQSLVTSIAQANSGEETFVYHTCLDSLFNTVWHLPMLALRIRKLFPLPFSGLLLAPDRRWPFNGARRWFGRHWGNSGDGAKPVAFVNWVVDRVLTGASEILRRYYLWQRNLVLRRSSCQRIAVLDERYMDWLKLKTGKMIVRMPETFSVDVSDPPPALVRMISERRQSSAIVVGLLGVLDRRKCLDVLVNVIREAKTDEFLFIIAGAYAPGTLPGRDQAFLEEAAGKHTNVVFSPEAIPSEGDFNAVVQSCDILFCVYRDHLHSSGVVSRAAAFRKQVLVNSGGLMANQVEEYSLGYVLTDFSAKACLEALRQMSQRKEFLSVERAAVYAAFMEDHSFGRFEETLRTLSKTTVKCEQPVLGLPTNAPTSVGKSPLLDRHRQDR
jgi:hypothetical protein